MKFVLVEKGETAPGPTINPFILPRLDITYNNYNITLNDAVKYANEFIKYTYPAQTDKYSISICLCKPLMILTY